MSYQTELDRIVAAKAAMRESIIAKGVEVPENAKLATYPQYIAEIANSTDPEIPDLSQPLDEAGYNKLSNIVKAGLASEYLNLGDEILVPYDSYIMPFEIVGFDDVEVEGGEIVHAINLLAKYTSEVTSTWANNGSIRYSASTLHSSVTTYQSKLDANFVACLANTKTQTYSRDGTTDTVYDKLFAPSMAQLGVTDTAYNNASQAAVEGPAFIAYQGATDNQRIKQDVSATDTPQRYWTRSFYSGNSTHFGLILTTGDPNYYRYSTSYRVVVAGNFVGSNLPNPGVYDLANLKLALATDNSAEYFPIG